ncbi:MAG TPA: DUF1549 domain-containing protein, partial [Planctomycetota bacterium]|nr:DUF1549 domain-containing protein [Planctomycetota bacterium]
MKAFALVLCLQAEIDRDVAGQKGFDPSRVPALAGDGEFLRRASLDLTGAPPTADEARAFLDDPEPDKRTRLVDRLVASDAFARAWARRLSGMLLGGGDALPFAPGHPLPAELRRALVGGFEAWLAEALRKDTPWDAIVTELLVSRGSSDAVPAVAWKLSLRSDLDPFPRAFAGYMPKQLLGIDMRCAVCHDHPFDKWTWKDAHDLMSFLPALSVQADAAASRAQVEPDYLAPLPAVPGFTPAPRLFVGGQAAAGEDRLEALARLVTASPQLDRAAANRVWAWMMGRGVVHPPDGFNMRHRPSSAALLSTLEKEFRRTGRSIKAFVRTVALTRA